MFVNSLIHLNVFDQSNARNRLRGNLIKLARVRVITRMYVKVPYRRMIHS